MKKNFLLLGAFALILTTLQVKADDGDKYAAFAKEIRREVWSQDLPEFKNTTIPEKYKNESAVILAAYSQLEITRIHKFDLKEVTMMKNQVHCRNLYRLMTYINDKVALKEFSEYNYRSQLKERYSRNERKQVLGVRVIKPDGTIREIDADEYLDADERHRKQEKWQKLVVPGLETGDIIDVFSYEYTTLNNQNLEPFGFYFMNNYPILSYSVHCEIDPKLSTAYRCLNGAPDFTRTQNAEGNYILDLKAENLDRMEPDLWYNPARQSPMILMYVIGKLKTPYYVWTQPSSKTTGLQANPDAAIILQDDWDFMKAPENNNFWYMHSGRKKQITRAVKARKAEGWEDGKLADYIYNYCFWGFTESGTQNSSEDFIMELHRLMKEAGISHQLGITTPDSSEPISQLISYRNTRWFIHVEANGKYYTMPACYAAPGEIPARIQGQEAVLDNAETLVLPEGKAEDNLNISTIKASIEGTTLAIHRQEEYRGTLKENMQPFFILDEDLNHSMRQQLGITETLIEQTKEKYRADQLEIFRQEREEEKLRYRNAAIAYHGSEKDFKDMSAYRLISIGNRTDSTAFIYEVEYTMNGFVKKAGQSLILTAGRLIGQQLEVADNQRKRKEDIYMSSARQFVWNILVNLPEGYQVSPEGLEKMNVRIENECGAFITQAIADNGVLSIKVEKRFNHKTEPAANWDKLLEIMDGAKAYEALSVVMIKNSGI